MTGKLLKISAVIAILELVTVSATSDIFGAVIYRTVAKTGDVAPGTEPGTVFGQVNTPSINNAGQVVFVSYRFDQDYREFDHALWSEGSGSLSLIAKVGDPAPGIPPESIFQNNVFAEIYSTPVINAAGETTFYASYTGGYYLAGYPYGIWAEASGSLDLAVRIGITAPGTVPELYFSKLNQFTLNNNGHTVFWAETAGSGLNSIREGIWSYVSGALKPVALEGNDALGTESGTVFNTGYASPVFEFISVNNAGQIVFKGNLTGSAVRNGNGAGIWLDTSGSLELLVGAGDLAPATTNKFVNFLSSALNDNGQIAFLAVLSTTFDRGIWSGDPQSLTLVAKEGAPAPGAGAGVVFASFGKDGPVLNGSGKTAFTAKLSGPGINIPYSDSVWSEGLSELTRIAQAGDVAPGVEPGTVFESFSDTVALNNKGQVVFMANIAEPYTTHRNGIWAFDVDGQLKLIACQGSLFDVDDDPLIQDLREVEFIDMRLGSSGQDGRPASFTDSGQLAFWLGFTDGSSGVFVATIPEPGTLGLLGVGAGLMMGKRGKRVA